jgi:zinc transport system permease protein
MIEIIGPALLTGIILAVLAGPLGSFVVWGRMAYFGDTLAHSALLGVGLGYLLQVNAMIGVIITTLLMSLLLGFWRQQEELTSDTLLGVMAHGTLAAGLVLASLLTEIRIDLMGLLFGDLLATGYEDLLWVSAVGLVVGVMMMWLWRPMLNCAISEELAHAEGLPVRRIQSGLLIMLAMTVAIGMKVVGALLMTAMLIIPAASARRLASTPEQMALFGSLIAIIAVLAGLAASATWSTPAGPGIVLASCLIFLTSLVLPHISQTTEETRPWR